MKLEPHIEYVRSKANRVLGLLRRNLKECPKRSKSMVKSLLEYASAVWDLHIYNDTTRIDQIQRGAARFVKHDYRIYFKDEQH